jgi:hypothetical protein
VACIHGAIVAHTFRPMLCEPAQVKLIDGHFDSSHAQWITQPSLAVLDGESKALWLLFGDANHSLLADYRGVILHFIPPYR